MYRFYDQHGLTLGVHTNLLVNQPAEAAALLVLVGFVDRARADADQAAIRVSLEGVCGVVVDGDARQHRPTLRALAVDSAQVVVPALQSGSGGRAGRGGTGQPGWR